MLHRSATLSVAAIVLVLTGCTTTSLKIGRASGPVSEGAPYSLYFTQYDVAVTRTLASCGPMKVEIEVEATPTTIPDPAERFYVDLNSLADHFKTSDVKLEYHGLDKVKSINAAAEDRSEAVAKAAVGGIGKLIEVGSTAAAQHVPDGCVDRVAAFGKAKSAVENRTKSTAAARRKVTDLTLLAGLAKGADLRTARANLATAMQTLETEVVALETAEADFAKAKKKIVDVQTFKWPTYGRETAASKNMDRKKFDDWAKGESFLANDQGDADRDGAYKRLAVGLEAQRWDLPTDKFVKAMPADVDPSKGIPFRQAARGRLLVSNDGKDLKDAEATLPQAGDLLYFPVESRPFQNVKFTMAVSETGALSSVGYEQKSARAEGMANVFKAGAEQAATSATALQDADTKALTREADNLKAKKALADARSALAPSADAAETADLNAELALLNARKALAKAQDAGNPTLDGINAEIAMAKARLELINANKALAAATTVVN